MRNAIPFQANNIVAGTALTLLMEIPLIGLDGELSLQISNSAGSATTDDFLVTRRLHDAGEWLNYIGGTDFAIATSKCIASTPGPHQLPAGESAWIDIDCGAAVAVQLWASVAIGTAILSIFGGGKTR